jgi:serine/threonine protein kinase
MPGMNALAAPKAVPTGAGSVAPAPADIVYPGELAPGEVLDGRFEILEHTNRGGMACIYRARDLQNGEVVAVKMPNFRCESDPLYHTRFLREEQIARLLDHPYILKVIPIDGPKSRPYLVSEFLLGTTLNKLMKPGRPMPEATVAAIAIKICQALEHLRQHGIVHRDLKPENIMICSDGSIRLLDFGIAAALRMRRLTFVGFCPSIGTPDYMSPEQVKGRKSDHRADIYSLGTILYEMMTGRAPFDGDDSYVVMQSRLAGDPSAPRQINPDLTPQIEEIVLHAMERQPYRRFGDAAQMMRQLEDYGTVHLSGRAGRLKAVRIRFWHVNPWIIRGVVVAVACVALQFAFFGAAYWFFLHQHGK